MMDEENYYPDWFSQCLLEDDFPWHAAPTVTLPQFLQKYSLHDSPWIGFWFGGQKTIAAFRWDTIWFGDALPYSGSQVAGWPFLLLRFNRVYQFLNHTPPPQEDECLAEEVDSLESFLLTPRQRETLLNASFLQDGMHDRFREAFLDDSLHRTVFQGTFSRQVHLYHAAPVQVLCLDRNGTVLPLPGLSG